MKPFLKWVSGFPEIVFAFILIILILLSLYFLDNNTFVQVQFPGAFLDVLIFGMLIVIFNKFADRRRDIKRWQEEIDDYRGWKSPEATYRIIGNIKRLNRVGITRIDLSFCYLKNANLGKDFQANVDKAEAELSPAMVSARKRGHMLRIPMSILAEEMKANLLGANLTRADLTDANLSDANLENANLYRAMLNGAYLFFANLKNANLRRAELKYSSFGGAILDGANLMDADLSGARNLSLDQLSKVSTLYNASLDPTVAQLVRDNYPRLLNEPADISESDSEQRVAPRDDHA